MTSRPGSRDVSAMAEQSRNQSDDGSATTTQPGRWSSASIDATPQEADPHRAWGVVPGGAGTVYAHIGQDGSVLYVGRTIHLDRRTKEHHQRSPWWADVVEVRSLHTNLTHEQSVELERRAIEAHDPPHNFVYTKAWRDRCGHGYVAYTHGCRCDECRTAKAAYIRERRQVAREVAARLSTNLTGNRGREWPVGTERHYVPGIRHGSSYAYHERGCRCLDCTQWETATSVARQRRVRQRRTAA